MATLKTLLGLYEEGMRKALNVNKGDFLELEVLMRQRGMLEKSPSLKNAIAALHDEDMDINEKLRIMEVAYATAFEKF